MITIENLSIELDDQVKRLRKLLGVASLMDLNNQLGEAARIPDELARAIACVADARNAATQEAFGRLALGEAS